MMINNQNKQQMFIIDIISKQALIKASKVMNTSQSRVISMALSQFLKKFIDEELNNSFADKKENPSAITEGTKEASQ